MSPEKLPFGFCALFGSVFFFCLRLLILTPSLPPQLLPFFFQQLRRRRLRTATGRWLRRPLGDARLLLLLLQLRERGREREKRDKLASARSEQASEPRCFCLCTSATDLFPSLSLFLMSQIILIAFRCLLSSWKGRKKRVSASEPGQALLPSHAFAFPAHASFFSRCCFTRCCASDLLLLRRPRTLLMLRFPRCDFAVFVVVVRRFLSASFCCRLVSEGEEELLSFPFFSLNNKSTNQQDLRAREIAGSLKREIQ